MNPVAPTSPFAVTLEAQQWNAVLAALAEASYKVAAPLIQLIGQQLQDQAPTATPNGAGLATSPPPN